MKNKKFDSVKMMREIRDKINKETVDLSDNEFLEKLRTEFPEINRKSSGSLNKKVS